MVDKKKQGRLNKAAGARFELKVRADLEGKGWFVSKFQNNVEFLYECEDCREQHKGFVAKCIFCHGKMKMIQTTGKMTPAKRKYNPFNKALTIGTGMPDFIAWKTRVVFQIKKDCVDPYGIEQSIKMVSKSLSKINNINTIIMPPDVKITPFPEIIGVEAKSNGFLDKTEKAKCEWLLANKVFSKILVASKQKEGRRIIIKYEEFKNA